MTTTRTTRSTTRPPADDQPFDFNLDTVDYDGDLSPFRVHFDGRRWEFEHMQELDCWDIIEAAEGGEIQMVLASFKLALGEQYEDFRKIRLPQYKLMPLFRAWQRHCGLSEDGSPLSGTT